MTSRLAWLQYDSDARARTHRILALFRHRDARDELGLAGVRDSFADLLFPGTTTIQTRLRYMLFVPWLYQRLEAARVSSAEIEKIARKAETDLISPLLDADELGVFGKRARGDVKRLPSSVYWAGLRSWGLLRFGGTQDDYHRALDGIYRERAAAAKTAKEVAEIRSRARPTWHEELPDAPEDFPRKVSFALRPEDARFLSQLILDAHPHTLLAFLVEHGVPETMEAPWDVRGEPKLSARNRRLLDHARLFAHVMRGAAIVYNYALAMRPNEAGLPRRAERAGELHEELTDWWQLMEQWRDQVDVWSLEELWSVIRTPGHTIEDDTKRFVAHWVEAVRRQPLRSFENGDAAHRVQHREMQIKESRSRFRNEETYKAWSGAAGMGLMDFRWSTVRVLLRDLAQAEAR